MLTQFVILSEVEGSLSPCFFGSDHRWCDDWYSASMNSDEVKKKYTVLANDGGGHSYKVVRGASWLNYDPVTLLSAYRIVGLPAYHYASFGFRLVVVAASP